MRDKGKGRQDRPPREGDRARIVFIKGTEVLAEEVEQGTQDPGTIQGTGGPMAGDISRQELDARFEALRQELRADVSREVGTVKTEIASQIGTVKTEITSSEGRLRSDLASQSGALKTDLATQVGSVKTDIATQIGTLKSDIADSRGDTKAMTRELRIYAAIIMILIVVAVSGVGRQIFGGGGPASQAPAATTKSP